MGHRALKGAVCKATCFLDAQEVYAIPKYGVLKRLLDIRNKKGEDFS